VVVERMKRIRDNRPDPSSRIGVIIAVCLLVGILALMLMTFTPQNVTGQQENLETWDVSLDTLTREEQAQQARERTEVTLGEVRAQAEALREALAEDDPLKLLRIAVPLLEPVQHDSQVVDLPRMSFPDLKWYLIGLMLGLAVGGWVWLFIDQVRFNRRDSLLPYNKGTIEGGAEAVPPPTRSNKKPSDSWTNDPNWPYLTIYQGYFPPANEEHELDRPRRVFNQGTARGYPGPGGA